MYTLHNRAAGIYYEVNTLSDCLNILLLFWPNVAGITIEYPSEYVCSAEEFIKNIDTNNILGLR